VSEGWRQLTRAVRQSFPDALVAPGISVGATDARHYAGMSDSIYRFSPIRLHKETDDPARIHGTNERVSVENFAESVRFYGQLITNVTTN
jgi:carboxypeptidase PM20D1